MPKRRRTGLIWGRATILHGQSARTVLLVRAVVPRPLGPRLVWLVWLSGHQSSPPGPAQEPTSSNLKIATVMLGRLQLHPTPLSTFFSAGPPRQP